MRPVLSVRSSSTTSFSYLHSSGTFDTDICARGKPPSAENQSQEGRRYIPSARTNRRRGGSMYPA
eukprot:19600-Pyramimonas_sp.AAC.1